MRILKKEKNRKDIEVETHGETDPLLHSFYVTEEEFGENMDNYC